MVPVTTDIGNLIKEMDMEGSSGKMATSTRVSGLMGKVKDTASSPTSRGTGMKVSGIRMPSMAEVRKHFRLVSMKGSSKTARKKEQAN